MQNFYVVTGGPGVGKTTVLTELGKLGYKIVPEDARRIIEEQILADGEGLPWKDKDLYTQFMLEASVESYQSATVSNEGIVFFDRGILDAIGYARMTGLDVTDEMNAMVNTCRYNRRAFILPPWFEIYKTDDARKQTWEEAVSTYGNLEKTYLDYGYELIRLPLGSVEERVEIILDHIAFWL